MTVGERLISYWNGQTVVVRAPVSTESLRAFEHRYGVTLPGDVKDYYQHADGFEQIFDSEDGKDYHDKNGFTFYPLSKVIPLDSVQDRSFSFPGSIDYFVFADYLDWCWAYAVLLRSNVSNVVIVGERDKPILVSKTFEEFVDRYTANDDAIYGRRE